jgi:hypothetical protein
MRPNKLFFGCLIFIFFLYPPLCHGQQGEASKGNAPMDSAMKAAVVADISKLIMEQYIFLDVAERMRDHINAKLSHGEYDAIADPAQFAAMLRADLFEISKDQHFYVEFNPERAELVKAQQSQSEEEVQRAERKLFERDRWINFGFDRLERLKGNVGYLDLSLLCNAENAGATAVAAMNFLAHADVVIIDLRDTPGGDPNMVQLLCSYFIKGQKEGRTHLNTFERRYDKSMEQFWTLSYVPGKRMYDTDLYVLTSQNTASGAEEFAYNMKCLKRATIVGEKTAGAANPEDDKVIQDVFVMNLPTGKPINPISGTNWEQTGIEPHISVPAEQALDAAYLMALEKALKKAEHNGQKFQINWALDGLRAKLNPIAVPAEILKKYAGEYGKRKIELKKGWLYYRRTGRQYKLVPLKENLFRVEGIDFFRVEFVMDANHRVSELVGLYDNGTKDPSKRIRR